MIPTPITLAGERLLLDPRGGAVWPAQAALVVADLHLEKGSAAARRGRLLPPWDTAATLERLALMIRAHRPRHVLCLGDSFHDGEGRARMPDADAARLAALEQEAAFIWLAGNHDGGELENLALGPITLRHIAVAGWIGGEISGHYHPRARVAATGTTIARPCFATDGQRLILPAIGAYTGGLELGDAAFRPLFPRGGQAFLLGRDRLFSFRFATGRSSRDEAEPMLWETLSG